MASSPIITKGATYPKGETQLEFKVGELAFNALNFEYLAVSGAKAQFKGSGRITGDQSGYSFIMTVVDGQLDGSGRDKIRMKIFNKNTNKVIYDNGMGASDAADPVTVVGAGSVITITGNSISDGGSKPVKNRIEAGDKQRIEVQGLSARVLNNPSNTYFTLITQSGHATPLNLSITDGFGRVVEVKKGIGANGVITIGHQYRPGSYYAQVVQGSERITIKLVKLP